MARTISSRPAAGKGRGHPGAGVDASVHPLVTLGRRIHPGVIGCRTIGSGDDRPAFPSIGAVTDDVARARLTASPRSPTTASSRTARTAAWWPRTARSSGCASPGPTRPASSERCSTAQPATSASGPSNTQVPHQRRYIPGTMVLETTWHTPTGWLLVQDLLVVRPVVGRPRRPDYRRAPGDSAATGTLLRLATCIEGQVEVVANCVPALRVRDPDRHLGIRRRRLRIDDGPPTARRPGARP